MVWMEKQNRIGKKFLPLLSLFTFLQKIHLRFSSDPLLISTEEEKNGVLQDDRFGQVSKMNEFIS